MALDGKHVAVLFFGLVKTITDEQLCAYSKHVFHPLAKAGAVLHVFLHTHKLESFANPANLEYGDALDQDASIEKLAAACSGVGAAYDRTCTFQYITTCPRTADERHGPVDKYSVNGTHWKRCPSWKTTVLYYIRQLDSIKEVYELACRGTVRQGAEGEAASFDAFVFLRPDVLFHEPLCLRDVQSACLASRRHENLVMTPSWHKFGGLNDRFAVASQKGASTYGYRLDELPRAIEQGFVLHAERFLQRTLMHKGKEKGIDHNYCRHGTFSRVRANGKTKPENITDTPPVCDTCQQA